jgi:hypothetical protein
MSYGNPPRARGFELPLSFEQAVAGSGQVLFTALALVVFSLYAEPSTGALALSVSLYGAVALVVLLAYLYCSIADPAKPGGFACPCVRATQERERYCRLCGKTVPGLDHHCTWLNTCIGKRNYFAFYILAMAGTAQYVLHVVFCALAASSWQREGVGAGGTAFASVVCIFGGVGLLAFGSLFLFHTHLLTQGIGTYDWLLRRSERSIAREERLAREARERASAHAAASLAGGAAAQPSTVTTTAAAVAAAAAAAAATAVATAAAAAAATALPSPSPAPAAALASPSPAARAEVEAAFLRGKEGKEGLPRSPSEHPALLEPPQVRRGDRVAEMMGPSSPSQLPVSASAAAQAAHVVVSVDGANAGEGGASEVDDAQVLAAAEESLVGSGALGGLHVSTNAQKSLFAGRSRPEEDEEEEEEEEEDEGKEGDSGDGSSAAAETAHSGPLDDAGTSTAGFQTARSGESVVESSEVEGEGKEGEEGKDNNEEGEAGVTMTSDGKEETG